MVLDLFNTEYRGDVGQSSRANSEHRLGRLVRRGINDVNGTGTANDVLVVYTALSAPRSFVLPDASTLDPGKHIMILDESGLAGTHNITVDGSGAQTINGALTHVINTNYGSVCVETDGSNWFILYNR